MRDQRRLWTRYLGRAHTQPEQSRMRDDRLAEFEPLSRIHVQCGWHVSGIRGQRISQRERIARGFGHAEAHMRTRDERGIAEQRDAAESELAGLEVVNRLEQRFVRRLDHVDEYGC